MTIPFYCVVIMLLLVVGTKGPAGLAQHQLGGYDNRHPRAQQAKLTGWGARAMAAHQNTTENFAPFAAAVLIAHIGGADAALATKLAITFVVARTIYPAIYIANIHWLRSLIWTVGFVATLGLAISPALGK